MKWAVALLFPAVVWANAYLSPEIDFHRRKISLTFISDSRTPVPIGNCGIWKGGKLLHSFPTNVLLPIATELKPFVEQLDVPTSITGIEDLAETSVKCLKGRPKTATWIIHQPAKAAKLPTGWTIKQGVLNIPSGASVVKDSQFLKLRHLHIDAGAKLTLQSGASISIDVEAADPIVNFTLDATAGSLYLKSQSKLSLTDVRVSGGADTILNSNMQDATLGIEAPELSLRNGTFTASKAHAALMLLNSKFELRNLHFTSTATWGLVLQSSEGKISEASFSESRGGHIQVFHSIVQGERLELRDAVQESIRLDASSDLNLTRSRIARSLYGVTLAHKSSFTGHGLTLEDIQIGFSQTHSRAKLQMTQMKRIGLEVSKDLTSEFTHAP